MAEVTEEQPKARSDSFAEICEQLEHEMQPTSESASSSNNDVVSLHRHKLQSALAALPKPDEDIDDNTYAYGGADGYNNDGYEAYVAPYSSSPVVSNAGASSMSTALTMYTEEPGYAHLYDSPVEEGPANKPSAPSSSSYSSRSVSTKNPYTGLSNQGATCYMNSLLQTMYMTPEFRKGLYQWQFGQKVKKTKKNKENGGAAHGDDATDNDDEEEVGDDEPEEYNIPFQLQKLFAKLQMSSHESISTKALTKSFGWTGADVFQQHDVQELCRVLFDAIEKSFKGTVNETLVNDLYQGSLKDYVQCHTCGHESSRIDNFLDLSLVIRPFGSEEMMKSVEEAIELFLRPELLNNENQWMCDQCKTKRDAIKGLKFSKLPYLLSLQLKRFDFDYATMNRIKLHNQVSFPKFLDMNSYVSDESGARGRGKIARKMSMERHELEAKAHKSDRMRRLSSMDESQPLQFADEDGEQEEGGRDSMTAPTEFDTWSATFDPQDMIRRNGPHVYELYSVLIHSGSALGGHYYAYIKSLETGKWFNFNDSHVSEISDDELKTAWGGTGGNGYGSRMSYSTCAYMLMYRLVSEKNINSIPKESIPEYLTQKMKADEDRLKQLEQERLEMTKKVLIRFFMKGSKPKNLEKSIHVYKTSTVREALAIACEAFAKEKDIVIPSPENVRLRGYNDYNCLLSDTYDGKEDATLTSLGIYAAQQLFIEVKSDDEEWEPYDPFKLQLFMRRFVGNEGSDEDNNNSDNDNSSTPEIAAGSANKLKPSLMARCIQVDDNATLGSLCALVKQKFAIPEDMKVRLVTKSGYGTSPVKILNKNEEAYTLNLRLKMDLHLTNGTEVFVEETSDLQAPSLAEEFFEREANMITVNFKYLDRGAEPIRIDRRETILTLKQKISNKIGLPHDKFKILRGINAAGVEIKTIDTTLYKLSIGTNHTVFVLEGTPLNRGEYNFRLVLHRPPKAAQAVDSSPSNQEPQLTVVNGPSVGADADGNPFDADELLLTSGRDDSEFTHVGQVVISEEMQVEEIRKRVWAILLEKKYLEAETNVMPSQIRLRDLRQNTMANILVNDKKLVDASSLAVYEGRGIVAQILPQPEQASPNHRVVEFVYVDRSKWRFSKSRRCEVVISKELQDMYPLTYLSEEASIAFSIPVDRLKFARIPYHRDSCDILEVVSYEFYPSEDILRSRTPDYQELILVIDTTVSLEFMNTRDRVDIQNFLAKKSEEKAKAQRAKYSSVSSSSGGGYQYHKPKEAALVIRTKSDKKGGSNASSNGVTIRTPTRKSSRGIHASSDTDEEDDADDYMQRSIDLFGDSEA
ncbi:Ubiquitin carboxyl-terminal hydrolase 47-like isoform x1, partial [Globisporangium splendens]